LTVTTRGALKINRTTSFVIFHSGLSIPPPSAGSAAAYIQSLITYLFSLAVGTDSNFLLHTVPRRFILKAAATELACKVLVLLIECPRVRASVIVTTEA
jgi:hypothetical protein